MDRLYNRFMPQQLFDQAVVWVQSDVWQLHSALELVYIAVTVAVGMVLGAPLRNRLRRRRETEGTDARLALILRAVGPLIQPTIAVILLWTGIAIARGAGWPYAIVNVAVSLMNAWIVIRLASVAIRNREWAHILSAIVWIIAALNILGLLQPAVDALDSIALPLGDVRISALTILHALVLLSILLWFAAFAARLIERRIGSLPNISPSAQVLFAKFVKFMLVTVAVLVAVGSVGIDLSVLAVFGGAVGVGVGFGLQKIVANFFSGIILLLDKSIKPGDTIGLAGTYGKIQSLNARFVSVVTRDGIEHLIPNEELIVNRVENWTYSNNEVRLKIPIGIAYGSDIRKAMALCVDATGAAERVLDTPKPVCLLKGFGDSSVDLEIRFWVRDPENGVSNVKSTILLDLWDRFGENGIEIPFPQRDLHLRSVDPGIAWPAPGPAGER